MAVPHAAPGVAYLDPRFKKVDCFLAIYHLRRLKKKMDKEGVMREIRAHRHFEKPSEKRRRKAARARMRTI